MPSNIQAWAESLLDSVRSDHPASLVFQSATQVSWRSRPLTYFGGSDYFRLGWHPRVRAAFVEGARRWGHDVAASRLTTGNHPLFQVLEKRLADGLGKPCAVLCASGFQSATVAAQCLSARLEHVFLDASAHACLVQAACVLPETVQVHRFDPSDLAGLQAGIANCGSKARVAIWSEGYLPRLSKLAPLREYLAMLPRSGWLLVDDAHGLGLLGRTGGGAVQVLKLKDSRVILAGTLSKAWGCGGGFIAGPAWLRKEAFLNSTVFAGATPVGLPYVEAALISLEELRKNGAGWRSELDQNVSRVREVVKDLCGHSSVWNIPSGSGELGPVISLNAAHRPAQRRLVETLLKSGIYPSLIRYPGGPAGGYFRFSISSRHTARQVCELCIALQRMGPRSGREV